MIDPITLEVIWSRLISVVDEQAAALIHSSFTTVVREAGDLSAGVFDRAGNMIAQSVTGTPRPHQYDGELRAQVSSCPIIPSTACNRATR